MIGVLYRRRAASTDLSGCLAGSDDIQGEYFTLIEPQVNAV